MDATTRLESSNRPACAQARFQTFQSVPSRPRVEHVLHYTLFQRLPDRFLAGHRISRVSSPPLPDTDVLSGVSSQTHLPFRPISWLLGIFVRPSALQPSHSLRLILFPRGLSRSYARRSVFPLRFRASSLHRHVDVSAQGDLRTLFAGALFAD